MNVVRPYEATDSNFTSSIPEPDASVGEVLWTAGTYTLGTQRIMTTTHKVYEVVADPSTADQPDVGAAKDVPTWIEVSYTNKWRAFDKVLSVPATATGTLTYTFTPNDIANSVAGFNLVNVGAVNVTVTDPIDGIVYDEDVDMLDLTNVVDFYTWFFTPNAKRRQFLLVDLPAYPDADVQITMTGSGTIGVGELAFGFQLPLGVTNYGTSLQLLTFTDKSTDQYGSLLPIQVRRTAKMVDFDVKIERNRINYVFNTLADLEAYPAVYYGESTVDDPTLVYGLYLDGQINISTPSLCDVTFNVRSLT